MQHISVSNATIGILVQGKGSPILFVHGFPLSHAMWSAQADVFAGNHRVLVPDLRGFGDSSISAGTVTMERFADDLHGMLHATFVDEPIVLCGLSMGGYVAWQFFQKYRAQLQALILCDTRAAADTPEAAANRLKLAESILKSGPQVAVDAMLPRLLSPKTAERRPNVVADLRSMILHNKPAGIAAALHGMAERPDCTDLLPRIDVPTLLVCGEEDQISPPSEMRKMAEAIPGAEFVEIPSAGHMSPMENPEAFNQAVKQFLGSLRF
jgi:3-oxoadipate enol-lactonase